MPRSALADPPLPTLPAPRPPAGPPFARRLKRAAGPASAVHAGALVLHLALLAAMAEPGTPLLERLTAWDGRHFVEIAAHGYPDRFTYTPDGELTGNDLAFFPLFPLLVRAVHAVTGLGWSGAAVLTAQLALLLALVLVHRLVAGLHSRRAATVVLVLLVAAQPMSLVFFMAYSESLFLALAAGTLLAARRGHWAAAGACAFLAGLTRPAGVAVVVALAVAAAGGLRRRPGRRVRPVAAVLLACTGTPLYLAWVAERLGSPDAWFAVQRAGWDTRWDWGGRPGSSRWPRCTAGTAGWR
ncbi:mannosyltransferase family protein [Kitasatospora phosalacinea]|uniref:mannosyltransferase family protein n=1 Tax=Kitasatospora phosalacinea TaxID=2065 RepID=UPI00255763D3|nr:mannosyltransferase family protein [Kitasatospora phosalacinea]